MVNDNISLEQSSTFQAVPSASLDPSKLLEDSSWFKAAEEAVKTTNGENDGKAKQTLKLYEDFEEEYEIVTEETLSKSLLALNSMNEATSVLNSSEVQTWDSNASYNNEVMEEMNFHDNMEILNSTIEERKKEEADQQVPVSSPNERPIRSRKPVQKLQIQWS